MSLSPSLEGQVVPVGDLAREYLDTRTEVDAAVARVLPSGSYVLGPEVEAFERELGAYLRATRTITTGSGTAALQLALAAAGLGPGDEVITAPNSDCATTAAIAHTGATPVWADIDPDTLDLSPVATAEKITDKTRAILPIHMFGRPADMPALTALAAEHDLLVIEDACLAVGAESSGQRVGTWGALGCFSLAPSKILGGIGDGGVIVTGSDELKDKLTLLRNYGHSGGAPQPKNLSAEDSWQVLAAGFNERLDALGAAVLRAKLPTLDARIAARTRIAARYDAELAGLQGLQLPAPAPAGDRLVHHAYIVRTAQRQRFRQLLADRGIVTRTYYTPPLHLQPAFAHLGMGRGSFPEAEKAGDELVALPIFPQLRDDEQARVTEAVREVAGLIDDTTTDLSTGAEQ